MKPITSGPWNTYALSLHQVSATLEMYIRDICLFLLRYPIFDGSNSVRCLGSFISTDQRFSWNKTKSSNISLAGTLAHRLQHCTACNTFPPASIRTSKIQNGHQGAPEWPTGSGKGCTPRFSGTPVNFCKVSFFDLSTPSMRKGCTGEKKIKEKRGKRKKRIVKIAFHYRHAS